MNGPKIIGQKGDLVLVQLSRNKYGIPHQGKRERARRLKQLIHGKVSGGDATPPHLLIDNYLQLKS